MNNTESNSKLSYSTSGPWIVQHNFNVCEKYTGRVIATTGSYNNGNSVLENIANAKLIAATPELLDFLKSVASDLSISEHDELSYMEKIIFKRSKELLNKFNNT